MKILHTSDWNLGKRFYNRDRFLEQKAVLAEIVNIANGQKVDLVIVTGNVFGEFNASAKARELFADTAAKLSAGGKRAVLVISGERDDVGQLRAFSPLAEKHGIAVITGLDDRAAKSNPSSQVKITDSGRGFLEITADKNEVLHIAVVPHGAASGEEDYKTVFAGLPEGGACRIAALRSLDNGGEEALKGVGFLYVAVGGTESFQKPDSGIYASGSVLDNDFYESNKSVTVAEISRTEGLVSLNEVPLTAARKTRNVILPSIFAADAALAEFQDAYTRLIISSDKPSEPELIKELKRKYPFLVDIAFNGCKEEIRDFKFIDPKDADVFGGFLRAAGADGAYGELFKVIMEDLNETAKA